MTGSARQRLIENLKEAHFAITEVGGGLLSWKAVKGIGSLLKTLPARLERSGLSVQQFVGIYPLAIDPDREPGLKSALESLQAQIGSDAKNPRRAPASAFGRARGLHSARIMLLADGDPTSTEDVSASTPPGRGALVLGLVFDGLLDDVLESLFDEGEQLSSALRHCRGFPLGAGDAEVSAFLKRGRLTGGYFFSDLSAHSQSEIARAAEIREAFVEFQREHPGGPTREQLKRFWDEALGEAPAPLSAFEKRIDDEERWIRRAAEQIQCGQARERRRLQQRDPGAARPRAVHAKHHGCLEAELIVRSDLPARFRHGVFAQERFRALIRLSNSRPSAQNDRDFDARGMAIKLLDVPGPRLFPQLPQGVRALDATQNQDFILLSHPTFFAKDVRDFTIMQSALESKKPLPILAYFARRPKSLGILVRTMLRRIEHPLDISYHSVTPYALGEQLAVKYSVEPMLVGEKSYARGKTNHQDPNYLRAVLQESVSTARDVTIRLKFFLHVRDDPKLPIEDAGANWSELGAKAIHAATLVIYSQDCSSPEKLELCERMAFNPWNGLAQHKPLGSLNRARLRIYQASAKARGVTRDRAEKQRTKPGGKEPTASRDQSVEAEE